MFGIGLQEIIVIALVVLLLFGGKKIPELMKGLGKGVRSFKDGMNGKEPYSEEKLYQIFKSYSDTINNQLGYTPTSTTTYAEFQEIWAKAMNKGAPKDTSDKKAGQAEGNGVNPTFFIFFFVLVLSFLFSYTRKRKS